MGGHDLKLRASAWPRAEGFVLKGASNVRALLGQPARLQRAVLG